MKKLFISYIILFSLFLLTFTSFWCGFCLGLKEYSSSVVIETPKVIEISKIEAPKIEYQSLGLKEISAYTLSREETDDDPCITASGINACESDLPIVATNKFPFWTWVEIDGKEYVVLDRMSKKYPFRFDILMKTKGEARQFGIQKIEVKLIK